MTNSSTFTFNYSDCYNRYFSSASNRYLTEVEIESLYENVDRYVLNTSYDMAKSQIKKSGKVISGGSEIMFCFIEGAENL